MDVNNLKQNMMDQILEAQVKLGYEAETVRLYYPLSSLNAILKTDFETLRELKAALVEAFPIPDPELGEVQFAGHAGRLEARISPEGAQYVHEHMPAHPFLVSLVNLFRDPHHCSLEKIRSIFAEYGSDWVEEKMPEGSDFDFVFYYRSRTPDASYYCVKEEMGHMIYHRFCTEDYLALL